MRAALLTGLFLFAAGSVARSDEICSSLVQKRTSQGIYLAKEGQVQRILGRNRYSYDPNGGLYIVLARRGLVSTSSSERAFVVKSKTFATEAEPATRVIANRSDVSTSCNDGAIQQGYHPYERFIDDRTYIDHHSDSGKGDVGLSNYFHFFVNDRSVSNNCFRTDNASVVKRREQIFLFERIMRPIGMADRTFGGGTAIARGADGERPNALSTDLIYVPSGVPQCFQVSTPIPSYHPQRPILAGFLPFLFYAPLGLLTDNAWAASESSRWRPMRTEIEVLALTGRPVLRTQTIRWSSRQNEVAARGQ